MSIYTSFFRRGNKVFVREIGDDGTREHHNIEYKPKLYMETDQPNCGYTTLAGVGLKEVEFSSIKAAREYADSTQFPIYGYNRWEYACVDDRTQTADEIAYKYEDLRVLYLDIETQSDTHYSSVENPDQPIVLIQIMFGEVWYIFGMDFYESYNDAVKFIRCKDEEDLLKKFVKLFRKLDPDIISGWNSSGYDIPMLFARMNFLGLEDTFKRMSPFNMIETKQEIVFGKEQLRVEILGIQHLDYIHLMKKFDVKKYENYKLDTVATEVLGKGKVAYKGSLDDLRITDYAKFVEYGLVDTQLVKELEDKKNLIQLVVMVGYLMKVNFYDSFSQVRMWDNKFMNYLKYNRSVQVPYKISKESDGFDEEDDTEGFEGAFVFEPKPARYEWVMSDDVQSLYPSIMMTCNVSPETYLDNTNKNVDFFLKGGAEVNKYHQELKDNNLTSLVNGSRFIKDYQGFIPAIITEVFDMRITSKDAMNAANKEAELLQTKITGGDTSPETKTLFTEFKRVSSINKVKQSALKVLQNSCYGATGNPYFRFYQKDIAEGITLTGQLLLKSVAPILDKTIKTFQKSETKPALIYGDTDSLYYSMHGIVEAFAPAGTPTDRLVEFCDRFHTAKLKPLIAAETDKVQKILNVFIPRLKFVRDVIADKAVFVAKKRYFLQILDAEGVRLSKPDLKIMGLESAKSSTPKYCREKIKESINMMLNSDNDKFVEFMDATKTEFMTLPVEKIAFPRGITDINKYMVDVKANAIFGDDDDEDTTGSKSGCPIHVKASIHHNNLLVSCGLEKRMAKIANGDKIKFIHLKFPNPIANNAIAFDETLPTEFGLDKYIDYDMQYEKTFLKPIKAITDIIGWDTEITGALF